MSEKLLPDWRSHIPEHIRVSDKEPNNAAASWTPGRPAVEEVSSKVMTQIETALDQGRQPVEIAKAFGLKVGTVYRISEQV